MATIDPAAYGALTAEPGRGPEVLSALQAAAEMLDEVPGAMHQLGGDEEDELLSVLLRLHGRAAQVTTVVAADAVKRGVLIESNAANTSQWLAGHLAGKWRSNHGPCGRWPRWPTRARHSRTT